MKFYTTEENESIHSIGRNRNIVGEINFTIPIIFSHQSVKWRESEQKIYNILCNSETKIKSHC